MPTVSIAVHRVNTLPGLLEASSIYIVKAADSGLMDLYITSTDGLEVRHIIKKSEIEALINTTALAMGVVRAVENTDGSYSLKLADNSILQNTTQVYAWPGITISGVDTLPDANTFENGTVVRLHKDNFVGFGANPLGIEIQADAINNIWRPNGRQLLWSGFFGLVDAPTVFLTAAGRFNIGTDPVLPAGLLNYTNARVRFAEWFYSKNPTPTTAPNISIHLGKDVTTYTNNPTILSNNINVANNTTAQPETLLRRETVSQALSTRNPVRGGTGASGGLINVGDPVPANTNLDFSVAQMITFASSSLGTVTELSLFGFEIAWEG